MQTSHSDAVVCELVSWRRVQYLARKLAERIRVSGYRPTTIVGIARGGLVPARLLCDYLDVYELAALRVEHYHRGADRQPEARIEIPLCKRLDAERVLLVDDVCDRGDSFELALGHVLEFGPAELRTAALHFKSVSSYRPDYYAHRVVKWRWLIYPWAVIEDLAGFIERMPDRPGDLPGLAKRLRSEYKLKVSEGVLRDAQRLYLEPDRE
jgi:hypoxanthine phosphoribosyltransferase